MFRWFLILVYSINIAVYGFLAVRRMFNPPSLGCDTEKYGWGCFAYGAYLVADASVYPVVFLILLLLIAFGALLIFKKSFFENHWSFKVITIGIALLAISPFILI